MKDNQRDTTEYKNKVIQGDCLIKLKELEDNSVDSIVTDPPYELGFMGKSWDNTGIANNKEMWAECLRVLKPGGHLLSFSGTRTYHRMASAIEDAGFEVRDMIEWVYGSGFPKSLNIGKAVDKLQGNEREVVGEQKLMGTARRMKGGNFNDFGGEDTADVVSLTKGTSEWEGWGTALKPAHEPICMARKPLAEKTVAENVLKYGTGGINIDESRVESGEEVLGRKEGTPTENVYDLGINKKKENRFIDNSTGLGRFPANLIHDNSEEVRECFPFVGSKSLPIRKTSNTGGTGNVYTTTNDNIGNIVGYGDTGNASRFFKSIKQPYTYKGKEYEVEGFVKSCKPQAPSNYNDEGSPARYFKSIIYQAKASKSERNAGLDVIEDKNKRPQGEAFGDGSAITEHSERKGNFHPTVKPIALMEYLIKMVTPKGGVVLDPFAGSGTTGVACKNTNRNYILIEKEHEYIDIINKRLDL